MFEKLIFEFIRVKLCNKDRKKNLEVFRDYIELENID